MRRWLLLAPILLAGCQAETSTCTQAPPVVGTWRYAGVEQTPLRATMTGTLSISSASCDGIAGQLDVMQTDASGTTRRLAGPVTGQAVDGVSFRFNAFLDANPRQHIASFAGDSLWGSWLSTDGTQSATGTFAARRQ